MDRSTASSFFLHTERGLESAWRWTSHALTSGLDLTPTQAAFAQFFLVAFLFLLVRDVMFRVAQGRLKAKVTDQINDVMSTISENAAAMGAEAFDVKYSFDAPKVKVTFTFEEFSITTEAAGRNHTTAALDALRLAMKMTGEEKERRRRKPSSNGYRKRRTGSTATPTAPKPRERFHADSPWWVVLGVPEKSTRDQVTSAYRTLVKKYHPDVSGNADVMVHLGRARRDSGL